jgi:hypothetical protein
MPSLAPADIGQRMPRRLRQRQPVGTEQMAGLAAHPQLDGVIDPDVAVAIDFRRDHRAVVELDIGVSRTTQPLDHQRRAGQFAVAAAFLEMFGPHPQRQLVAHFGRARRHQNCEVIPARQFDGDAFR